MQPDGRICYDHAPADFNTLINSKNNRPSAEFRKELQLKRKTIVPVKYIEPNSACKLLLKTAFERLEMSAMDYNITLELSSYIAALDNANKIKPQHIAEAIHYRVPELDNISYTGSIPVLE